MQKPFLVYKVQAGHLQVGKSQSRERNVSDRIAGVAIGEMNSVHATRKTAVKVRSSPARLKYQYFPRNEDMLDSFEVAEGKSPPVEA